METAPGIHEFVVPSKDAMTKTEREGNVGSALQRMLTSERDMDIWEREGFNPTSKRGWLDRKLPDVPFLGDIKSEGARGWQPAMDEWAQGLLRLESGAAIAYKEQKWYERTFFPVYGDTPRVVAQKRRARQELMGWFHEIISSKTAPGDNLQMKYNEFMQQREQEIRAAQLNRAGPTVAPKSNMPGDVMDFGTYVLVPDGKGGFSRVDKQRPKQ